MVIFVITSFFCHPVVNLFFVLGVSLNIDVN